MKILICVKEAPEVIVTGRVNKIRDVLRNLLREKFPGILYKGVFYAEPNPRKM